VTRLQPFAAPAAKPSEVEEAAPSYRVEEPPEVAQGGGVGWPWQLWERRQFLGRAAVWGLVLSAMVAFVIPKRYDSTTRLMPPDTQSSSGMAMMAALAGSKGSSGLGALAGDLLGTKSSGDLFIDILHSRTVEDRLIERFDLRRVYWDKYWQDARKDLAKNTTLSEDRKSGVITITVTDRDPQRAAEMARAYVEELDRLVAEVSTSSARRERLFIEQRLASVKQDLDHASHAFSEYASQNTAIDIEAQGKATVEAAAKLEGELIAAESELEGLEQIYTKGNVRVRSLQARVDELRSQLHKIGGDTADPAGGKPSSTQEFPSIRQLPLLGVRWADLYRETKIQETVYEMLTQQYELAKIEEAKEIPVVKVLDPSDVPEKKSFPPRSLIGGLGMLLALLAACTWTLARYQWDSTSPSNPRKAFLREVGTTIRSDGHRLWRRSLNGRIRTGYDGRNGGHGSSVSPVPDNAREEDPQAEE
jgi:capsule polysaccharide export protein KpsE/RkpR